MEKENVRRIVIEVDNDLHCHFKAKVALSGKSMKEVINELLLQWIKNDAS